MIIIILIHITIPETYFVMILISHLQSGGSCDGSLDFPHVSRESFVYSAQISCAICLQCTLTVHSLECCVYGKCSCLRLPTQPSTYLSIESLVVLSCWEKQPIVSFPQFWFWLGNKRLNPKILKVLAIALISIVYAWGLCHHSIFARHYSWLLYWLFKARSNPKWDHFVTKDDNKQKPWFFIQTSVILACRGKALARPPKGSICIII